MRPARVRSPLGRRPRTRSHRAHRLVDLSDFGVPVLTQWGPGGGISLLGDWSSPASGLTRDEVDSVPVGSSAAGDRGLVVKARCWYLAAQAPGGSPRTYRVARIRSAE